MMSSLYLRYGVAVFAVVAIDLLAGLMLGTGMENYTYRTLPETS